MKGSYRRLIIAVAVLLVVVAAGSVLYAQAMAGTGVGFGVMKALADTGGGDAVAIESTGQGGPGMPGMSCSSGGGGCGGEEGGSSCGMSAPGAASAEGDACSMGTPEVEADAADEAEEPDTK